MVVVGFIIIACGAFSLQAIAAPGYSEAEVDRMIRQLDRKNLVDLKKNQPQLYEEQVERIACHRIEGTTYHYPCMCLWMGEWNWETYEKVFRVEIPDPIMEFDLRDDVPSDNYSNVSNVFRLFAKCFYNTDVKNIKKISDTSGKEMMNGIGPLPGKYDRKQRPIARLLFTARRKYKSKEYMFFVYRVQSDKNPEDDFVKLHVAMFKQDKTRWFFTNELSWSLLSEWPLFARYDNSNLPYLPTYDEFRSVMKNSELPSEFYELKSTVTNAVKSNGVVGCTRKGVRLFKGTVKSSMKDKKIKNFLMRTPETASLPREHCSLTVKLQL